MGVSSRHLDARRRCFFFPLLTVAAVASGVLPRPAHAQEEVPSAGPVRLTALAGFEFSSEVSTASGSVYIDSAPTYGAALSLALDPEWEAELLWTISSTYAHVTASAGYATSSLPNHVDINYFQAGVTKTVRCGIVECFGDLTLGAVLLLPGTVRLNNGDTLAVHDTWRAAFTLGAGARLFIVDRFAIVLQARLLAPIYVTSGGFYSGKGGTEIVVNAGIPCLQVSFSAGLALVL